MKKQRVVCIDDSQWSFPDLPNPIKGEIYTIFDGASCQNDFIGLVEIPRESHGKCSFCGGSHRVIWASKFFRPVDDTFGEVVAERVEQMIELEQTITI